MWSRYISPCARVGSSVASSTWMAAPSGRTTRGPCGGAAGGGVAALFCGELQASIRTAMSTARSFLILHLHILRFRIARDEVVLLRVVAERAEGHPQQLRRLRLHAAAALQ